jgi:ribosomal protein S18 acetylase RimI-like enzyme
VKQRANQPIQLRLARDTDRNAIWKIMRPIIRAADTYALAANMSRKDALALWFGRSTRTYVACEDDQILGTYILRPNQAGGGDHVANSAFMVAPAARGRGLGRAMAKHCFAEAHRLGFRAIQFNFVVSTNSKAIQLWQEFGMQIVARLPGAFRHPTRGYVDAYVMYRTLDDQVDRALRARC